MINTKIIISLLIISFCSGLAMEQPAPLTENEKLFLRAAAKGTLKEVKAYIAAGVSINTEDQCGENALYKAVFHRNWRVADYLMKNGTNLNYHPHNHGNNSSYIHRLVSTNETPEDETHAYFLLDYALNRGHADPNPIDKYGDTPLDNAYRKDNIAFIRLLKKAGGVRKVPALE